MYTDDDNLEDELEDDEPILGQDSKKDNEPSNKPPKNFNFKKIDLKKINFNKILNKIKKIFSNKFNIAIALISVLILVFGIIYVHNLIYGEKDYIIYGDYVDGRYDFNNTQIIIRNGNTNKVMSLQDFVLCMTHTNIDNNPLFQSLNDLEKTNVYKTYFISLKTSILAKGYDSNTKTIYINEKDYNCCSTVNCDLDSNKYPLLFKAYLDSKHEILVPNSYNEEDAFISFKQEIKYDLSENTINEIINTAKGTDYKKALNNIFGKNYKLYNMTQHADSYKADSNIKTSFYYPIGSDEASDANNNIYAKNPVNSNIIKFYDETKKGIEIEAKYGTRIIAITAGTVEAVMRNDEYGFFAKIKHGEYTVIYGNLNPNVVNLLKMGQTVKKGQLVGYLQNDSSVLAGDGKLIFVMQKGNMYVNPLQYVSEANARPTDSKYLTYVAGKDNKQTVCLSLLATGFSQEAVAGLLANINAESGFRTNALGDRGTSIGLCQWHAGRYKALMNFCKDRYKTVECQLDYLLYELHNGEKNSFKVLQAKNSAYQMTTKFCQTFERPAGGATACNKRANNFSAKFYSYVKNKCK